MASLATTQRQWASVSQVPLCLAPLSATRRSTRKRKVVETYYESENEEDLPSKDPNDDTRPSKVCVLGFTLFLIGSIDTE